MSLVVVWLVLAGILAIAELLTGTFYLLMIAIGFAAGGLAAWIGLGFELQALVAAVVSLLGVWFVRRGRKRRAATSDPQRNRDLLLDIGQTVDVGHWREGRARVTYRGAQWDVIPESPADAVPGTLVIRAVHGSTLVLAKAVHDSKESQ